MAKYDFLKDRCNSLAQFQFRGPDKYIKSFPFYMGLSISNDSLQLLSAPIKILKAPLGWRVMGSMTHDKQSGFHHAEQRDTFSSR